MTNNNVYTDKYSYPNYPHAVVKNSKVIEVLFFELEPNEQEIQNRLIDVDHDLILSCSKYGMAYVGDEWHDPFITLPKPYPSSVLGSDGIWNAPIPMPVDGATYYWDEPSYSWVKIELN
jgi:hypothetical protein